MGKISEAFEKHRRDSRLKVEPVPIGGVDKIESPLKATFNPDEIVMAAKYDPKLVVVSAPDSMDAENFKILRAQILFPKDRERPKAIMVTSALPGEGKSFIASNLAASISLGFNEFVLLIDCDLRRPSLHKMFGISASYGLHEYLTGKAGFEDVVVKTGVNKLTLLAGGTPSPNPTELLASQMMKDFLEEVKNRYEDRYVIIDSTPVQVTAEANVLARYVDGIVFVIMAERASKELIQRSIEALGKEKILGIVFNGYDQSYRGYQKYYKKYYKNYQL